MDWSTLTMAIRRRAIMLGVLRQESKNMRESKIFSFANIYDVYIYCRKNKRNTINRLEFEADLLQNLWNLQSVLFLRNYKIRRSLCFLTSSPKLSEIFATDFRDRIVHMNGF